MLKHSLAVYLLTLRKKREKESLILSSFGDESYDFLDLLKNYLEERKSNYSDDDINKKIIKVSNFTLKGRIISGIIETGEYGLESYLYNVRSRKVSYKRKKDDAEVYPFYFLFEVNENEDEAIVIFQRIGSFGVRSIFGDDFNTFLNENYDEYLVELDSYIPMEILVDDLKKGKINRISYISRGIPTELEDVHEYSGHTEASGYLEVSIFAGRNGLFNVNKNVIDIIKGKKQMSSFIQLRDFGARPANVKVSISRGKKDLTLDVSNYRKIKSCINLPPTVILDDRNHPNFNSLDDYAKDLALKLRDDIS